MVINMESNSIQCATSYQKPNKVNMPYKAAKLFGFKPDVSNIFIKKQSVDKK